MNKRGVAIDVTCMYTSAAPYTSPATKVPSRRGRKKKQPVLALQVETEEKEKEVNDHGTANEEVVIAKVRSNYFHI